MSRFDLTEDQIAIRDMARGFASDKLAPNALTWDEHKHFPVDVLREAAALGMGGIYVREDVGGSGLTRFDAALIFEALAAGDPSISAYISIHNMFTWISSLRRLEDGGHRTFHCSSDGPPYHRRTQWRVWHYAAIVRRHFMA